MVVVVCGDQVWLVTRGECLFGFVASAFGDVVQVEDIYEWCLWTPVSGLSRRSITIR
jgi:hypothetical protein